MWYVRRNHSVQITLLRGIFRFQNKSRVFQRDITLSRNFIYFPSLKWRVD